MTRKIVIIEDNERNMKLFKAVLKILTDVQIFSAIDGDAGADLIRTVEPDLVILDIYLPNKSGIDICTEFRKIDKFKDTPILAVTSFAMKGDKERIMSAGFNEYISKPIKVVEFREIVKKYLSLT